MRIAAFDITRVVPGIGNAVKRMTPQPIVRIAVPGVIHKLLYLLRIGQIYRHDIFKIAIDHRAARH